MTRIGKRLAVVVIVTLALTVLILDLQPTHFQRGEAIIDQLASFNSVREMPRKELRRAVTEYEESLRHKEGKPRAYVRLVWLHRALKDERGARWWANAAREKVDSAVLREIQDTLITKKID